MTTTTLPRVYITLMVVLFSFPLLNGCKEEPLLQITQPGILEVRMKTITTTYAPPSDTTRHAFGGNVNSLFAIRGDDTRMEVFADVRATDRSFFQIDLLAPRAWDSSMIIGQSYTPPGTYKHLDMSFSPLPFFSFYNGIQNVPVSVYDARAEGQTVISLKKNIPVEEGRTTIVTVTADLDSSLSRSIVQGFDILRFHPKFRISSVKIQ